MRLAALSLSLSVAFVSFACGGETVDTANRGGDAAGASGSGSAGRGAGTSGSAGSGVASAGGSGGSGTAGSAGSVAGASGATGSGGFGGSGDAIADFVQAVDGVWLVGWSGGANHYSWMRFSLTTEGQGVLEVLDPTDVLSNIPFWNCQGVGSWNVAARENTLFLSLPKGCDPPAEAITFGPFEKIDRPGVLFRSAIEINSTPTFDNVEGFKVESSRCDAAFTVCEGPF